MESNEKNKKKQYKTNIKERQQKQTNPNKKKQQEKKRKKIKQKVFKKFQCYFRKEKIPEREWKL